MQDAAIFGSPVGAGEVVDECESSRINEVRVRQQMVVEIVETPSAVHPFFQLNFGHLF